jgi:hypothetical protein
MSEGPLEEKLTDLATVLQPTPQRELSLPKMEDLKAWLDDTRFQLWGQLQAAQAPADQPEFEDRFRVRRAAELCRRLVADLESGQIDRGRSELDELALAAGALERAIRDSGAASS